VGGRLAAGGVQYSDTHQCAHTTVVCRWVGGVLKVTAAKASCLPKINLIFYVCLLKVKLKVAK